MYSITCNSKYRNNLVEYLNSQGIGASVHFDPPLHRQAYLKKYCRKKDKLKNTEELSKSIITLPMYPDLKMNEINYVLKIIHKWYKKKFK